jgi:hypothetical protein
VAYKFLDTASTPSVRKAQKDNGAKDYWAGFKGDRTLDRFTENEMAFIEELDNFYMASIGLSV